MKVVVDWRLQTDGDFYLRNKEFYDCIFDEDEDFGGCKEFQDDNEVHCIMKAKGFLREMLTDIHVSSSHYYLLRDIYEMFESLIEFVNKRQPGSKVVNLSGNYDGTYILVMVSKDEDENETLKTLKYPEYIMEKMRERIGLDINDTSKDAEINEMSKQTVLQNVLEWEGIIGYTVRIIGWIEDIYGIHL